jgi:hypothetical protein
MKTTSRTLVKSQPELWELIDQPERMQGLMCALLGRATEVTVDKRRPESVLRWQASGEGGDAWIEVELAEKGWETNVSVKAENAAEPTKLEGWLDAVLDELATPQKRPFEGMTETPAGTLAEAASSKAPQPAPAAEPQADPAKAEPAKAEDPVPQAAPEPQTAPRKRRFLLF